MVTFRPKGIIKKAVRIMSADCFVGVSGAIPET